MLSRMKQPTHTLWRAALAALVLPAIAALFAACDVSSTDSVSANISNNNGESYDFTGTYYAGSAGEPLVTPKQSGQSISWLRLIQDGSGLQGYDSARQSWSGSISKLDGDTAHFSMQGRTTAGIGVDIAGSLTYASGSATMNASWIENGGLAGTIYGVASVSGIHTNSPTPTNAPPEYFEE